MILLPAYLSSGIDRPDVHLSARARGADISTELSVFDAVLLLFSETIGKIIRSMTIFP
jgi:hypothetical protein